MPWCVSERGRCYHTTLRYARFLPVVWDHPVVAPHVVGRYPK